MRMFVGFDTSNYTTSVSTYDTKEVKQAKRILSVKPGEKGIRQSEAVFQHNANIPELVNSLDFHNLEAVGVSIKPRNVPGSYMPCFLVGECIASAVAKTNSIPLYKTSHQIGHILSALYSCNRLDLISKEFIAFHLSGGTTEALLVSPDENDIIKADLIAQSSDLKAGQAIDRTGVMLGMSFPCGKELDDLSKTSDKNYIHKLSFKDFDCSLSGVENKVKRMISDGAAKEDTAKFVLTYIAQTIDAMTQKIINKYGEIPIIFSGGVSSNSILRNTIINKYNAFFAQPEYSLDNAAGTAIYAYLKSQVL